MKKIFYLLTAMAVLIFGSSCNAPKHCVETSFLDYSHLNKQGIFVTESWSVPFDYIPIGSILITEYSGSIQTTSKGVKEKKFAASLYYSTNKDNWKIATPSSALDTLACTIKRLGADGLIGLEINDTFDRNTKRQCVKISGMVIKRK